MNDLGTSASPIDKIASDEVFLSVLRGSTTLEMLGISDDDLKKVSENSDLLETLRISHGILAALKAADVLHTFLRLPKHEQANFLRWIASTDGQELRRDRTATFISALKEAPLEDDAEAELTPEPSRAPRRRGSTTPS